MGEEELKRNGSHKPFDPSNLLQLPQKLQHSIKSQLNRFTKGDSRENSERKECGASTVIGVDQERQLQAWRDNPSWVDPPPQLKVTVPKGSLCNLDVEFQVGLPPDAVYDILTDPENRRVFKNIKEVLSRRVLLDEGNRQVVEVEQAAMWKFLWWSGTFAVNVLVDQNRDDYSMKFKQQKTGFMKKFEGCWRVEPAFVDESICYPLKPKTWPGYCSCTGGKGRVGSKVRLEQLIQPALVPPPPISWYLRGITSKTTEMIVNDLIAEAARIRGDFSHLRSEESAVPGRMHDSEQNFNVSDIKERWKMHRKAARKQNQKLFTVQ